MLCDTASILFTRYARAAMEHFGVTDRLVSSIGRHGQFAKEKEAAERLRAECGAARLALEQHWVAHGCQPQGSYRGFRRPLEQFCLPHQK